MIEFDLHQALQDAYDWDSICQSLNDNLETIKVEQREAEANQIWCQLQLFSIWRDYVNIYELLKNKNYFEGWCEIEQVLISNKYLIQNFPEENRNTEFVSSHLIKLQLLFPYRLFLSTVMCIKKETCSICGSEISPWSNCGHIPGKIYNGQLCLKVAKDFEILGADIVLKPEHKYAVLFAQDDMGHRIDNYDYSYVDTLIKCWKYPFQNWELTMEELYINPSPTIKDADPCPCLRSFLTYAECCKKRPGILSHRFIITP